MSQQGLKQASFRAIHGGAGGTWNEDAYAAFRTEADVPEGATFNEAFILWLQARLATTDDNLPGLMQAFAEAEGASNFASLGSFPAAHGLIDFGQDNAASPNRHYQINHVAALDLNASTGWAWGVFTYIEQNAGSDNPNILGAGLGSDDDSFNLFLKEVSHGNPPDNNYGVDVRQGGGGGNFIQDVQDAITLGQLRLLVVQYDTSDMSFYRCDPGQSAVQIGTDPDPDATVVVPTNWNFGRRSDGDNGKYYQERAGGLWKADRALTTDEIEQIAAGKTPYAVLGSALAGWWPFNRGAGATEADLINGNTATRFGTWA